MSPDSSSSWRPMSCSMAAACFSHNGAEPSMSVSRKVTMPSGGLRLVNRRLLVQCTADEGQALVEGGDAAVELGFPRLAQEESEQRTRRQPKLDEVPAHDQ